MFSRAFAYEQTGVCTFYQTATNISSVLPVKSPLDNQVALAYDGIVTPNFRDKFSKINSYSGISSCL
ncbi:hypothetical protein D6779_03865 [Candidatus Parcubacteria bacterium]|nr:MAG: hypothetical protein D6779_03865 [Candidatus Parcubacteria bacterium]